MIGVKDLNSGTVEFDNISYSQTSDKTPTVPVLTSPARL